MDCNRRSGIDTDAMVASAKGHVQTKVDTTITVTGTRIVMDQIGVLSRDSVVNSGT